MIVFKIKSCCYLHLHLQVVRTALEVGQLPHLLVSACFPQHLHSLIRDISSLFLHNMKKVLLSFDERRPLGRVQVRRLQDRQVQV